MHTVNIDGEQTPSSDRPERLRGLGRNFLGEICGYYVYKSSLFKYTQVDGFWARQGDFIDPTHLPQTVQDTGERSGSEDQ